MTPGKNHSRTGNAAIPSSCTRQQLQADLSLNEMWRYILAGNSINNHKGIVVMNYFNILCMNGAIGEFST
jgi:hypothetical protein